MKKKLFFICVIIFITCAFMTGCDAKGGEALAGENADGSSGTQEGEVSSDPYEDYIKSAIAGVDGKTPSPDEQEDKPAQESAQPFEGKSIQIDRSAPEKIYYSSMENADGDNEPSPAEADTSATPTPVSSTEKNTPDEGTPSPTADPSGTPTPEPTPYITPEEFDVGTCCIYMNGESDSAYGTEVVTAINKAREDLGYKPFVENKGLATCADRRTRELAAYYSHTRPNGLPFYSVAPEHFKAEILMVGTQKAEDAVDTLIKKDPQSRSLIFTNKYRSIGASSFKCNGKECMVVAFGL